MSALTDYFTSLANKIRSKTGKEGTLTPSDMVDEIDDVYSAGTDASKVGTAAASDVLSGKTFTNRTTVGENGSMTNNGAVSVVLDTTNTSYTVPEGYHSGSGNVGIITQTKSASSRVEAQTIIPDSGKVLSSVSVGINPLIETMYPNHSMVSGDLSYTDKITVTNTTSIYGRLTFSNPGWYLVFTCTYGQNGLTIASSSVAVLMQLKTSPSNAASGQTWAKAGLFLVKCTIANQYVMFGLGGTSITTDCYLWKIDDV